MDESGIMSMMGMLGQSNPYVAAGSAALGLAQTIHGFVGLNKASKTPIQQYAEDGAMTAARQQAQEMARSGYTQTEKTAFNTNISRRYNSADQRIKDTAGGLGSLVAGQIGVNRSNADLQFAAQDASLQRQNIRYADQFAQNLQNLKNKNVETANAARQQALQAYGGAAQSGLNNMAGALNAFGATGGFNKGDGTGRTGPKTGLDTGREGGTYDPNALLPPNNNPPSNTAPAYQAPTAQSIMDGMRFTEDPSMVASDYQMAPGQGPVAQPSMMAATPNFGFYDPNQF